MVVWVTQRQEEKPCFTGRRIEASESAVYKGREALSVLFAEGLCILTTSSNVSSSSSL